jgi:hypothetical protein
MMLTRKEIETLTLWCDHGERQGKKIDSAIALLDHPLAQWAYELGLRVGSRNK